MTADQIFRATGSINCLPDGGIFEHVQKTATHESQCTTKPFGRTNYAICLDEIERILIQT